MQLGQVLNELYVFSRWIDENVPPEYKDNPLALKWLRCAKAPEEAGEAIAELISATGGNPRKTPADNDEHLYRELADVALTGILALLHLLDEPAAVGNILVHRIRTYNGRMVTSGLKWPTIRNTDDVWVWNEQADYDSWLDEMFAHVPDCWGDDVAAESILVSYIRNLEQRKSQHTVWCDENYPNGH